jgi:CRISPR-associated protein Cmr6
MSHRPLPPALSRLMEPANPSLYFDKGLDAYDRDWSLAAKKQEFLTSFVKAYEGGNAQEFKERRARRIATLERRGAKVIPFTTHGRLAIGLGLPHPIETGFLFDRLTGSPYLPGSSVKGLLRAAARRVAEGELPGSQAFWKENLVRVFGPEIDPETTPKKGQAIFHDAFPAEWPKLEVDVLTPHYPDYYRNESDPPADWQNPNPVAFLTVAPNVKFEFPIAAKEEDLGELQKLLGTALDWLGIGAKKSAGYGVFGEGEVKVAEAVSVSAPAPKRQEPPPPPPPPPLQEVRWTNAELKLSGSLVAYRGKKDSATGPANLLEDDDLRRLKKKKSLRAEVVVMKTFEGWRIVRVVSIEGK